MKKLKKLDKKDLDEISNYLSSVTNDYILANVSSKEIIDIDIKIEVLYEEKLDVDMDINIEFDELSKADANIAHKAIENSLSQLDTYLDNNFRI